MGEIPQGVSPVASSQPQQRQAPAGEVTTPPSGELNFIDIIINK